MKFNILLILFAAFSLIELNAQQKLTITNKDGQYSDIPLNQIRKIGFVGDSMKVYSTKKDSCLASYAMNLVSKITFSPVTTGLISRKAFTKKQLFTYRNQNTQVVSFPATEQSNVTMTLFSTNGQKVYEHHLAVQQGDNSFAIQLDKLANGLFICRIQFEGGKFLEAKFINK
jgi:hypothetical protein